MALVEFVRDGQSPSQRDVAEAAGINETRISKWKRDDAFVEEADRLQQRHLRIPIERAHRGMLRQAEKGNALCYEKVMAALERQGRIPVVAAPGEAGVGPQLGVQINVHGIPERAPLSALPPLLTSPVALGPASSTPPPAK